MRASGSQSLNVHRAQLGSFLNIKASDDLMLLSRYSSCPLSGKVNLFKCSTRIRRAGGGDSTINTLMNCAGDSKWMLRVGVM